MPGGGREARSPEHHGAAEEGGAAGELAEAAVGHQHQPHQPDAHVQRPLVEGLFSIASNYV